MIKRTVTKFLFASTAGSMIGLATIIASISSSVAAVQTLAINAPDKYSISHIVLFLQSPSGTISRVKIDNFPDGIMSYDPNKVLSQYPNTQLVAYSVKAGNNKFNETSDALPVIIDSSVQMSQLPIDKEAQKNTTVYQYTKYPTGSSTIPVVSNPTPENNTPVVSNPAPENNTPVVSNPAPENNTPVVSNPAPENNTPVVSNPAPENNTPVVSNPAPENNTPVVSNPAPENNTPVVSNPAPEDNTPVVSNPAPEDNTPVVSNPAPENNTPVASNPTPEDNTPVASNSPTADSGIPHASKTTQVPEPGTMAALALFGLGGLFAKKKIK